MSLLETFLSVTIAILMITIAVPTFKEVQEIYVLNSAARQVQLSMNRARIHAAGSNQDCRLRVTSEVTYLIECQKGLWTPVEYDVTPKGIHVAANARPEFHKRGNVSPTATVTVWNRAGRQRKVIVNNAGRTRVE